MKDKPFDRLLSPVKRREYEASGQEMIEFITDLQQRNGYILAGIIFKSTNYFKNDTEAWLVFELKKKKE